ncbi:YezD family protein [Candidimonas humi]|jgi:hypothetical protein|uniref:YezD family protein n=1 Tax=Candidimonas humi TaxID=683355 RepID=A0ABV8P4Q8_9BURK|nr:YezD family protein [Candidimonas humi]MBV6307231.1 YezD family protein [Candidimonas humi]
MSIPSDIYDSARFDELLALLQQLVGPLHYGTVELTFHQGKLVQLEKKEKLRVADTRPRN